MTCFNIRYIYKGAIALPFILALILGACNTKNKSNVKDTALQGNIGFASQGKLLLIGYADSIDRVLGIKSVLSTTALKKGGDYQLLVHANIPDVYDLKLDDSLLLANIYIKPKEQLVINFGAKHAEARFSTDNMSGKYNEFHLKMTKKFYNDPDVHQMYYISANYFDISHFEAFILNRKKQMFAFYDSFFSAQKADAEFDKYAKAEITYQYGIDKLMYLWKKRIKNMDIKPDSSYYKDIITPAYLENNDAVNSRAYIHFLNLYINNIYGEKMVAGQVNAKNDNPVNPAVEKYKLAKKYIAAPYNALVVLSIIHDEMPLTEFQALKANKTKPLSDAMNDWFQQKYLDSGK